MVAHHFRFTNDFSDNEFALYTGPYAGNNDLRQVIKNAVALLKQQRSTQPFSVEGKETEVQWSQQTFKVSLVCVS